MRTQHEFCFRACSTVLLAPIRTCATKRGTLARINKVWDTRRIRCQGKGDKHTVKHLALCTQAIALGDKVVDLLTTLQHTLDGLMQGNLGLIELHLDFEDAVGLVRVLVLGQVVLELRDVESWVAGYPGRLGVI